MYLKERERYQIEFMLKEGYSVKTIAQKLNRHVSTIYREKKRGEVEMVDSQLRPYKKYCADTAQMKYEENRTAKGAPLKIGNDFAYAEFIEKKIMQEKYSPQAVLFYIKTNNLKFNTTVCHRTLYSYIDKGIFLHLTNRHLLVKKNPKKPRHSARTCPRNALKRPIEERPHEAGKRLSFGHWEMDTVYSGKGKLPCLLVLSERMTRQEIVIKMPDRTAKSTVSALDALEKKYGEHFPRIFKTITVDNGVEFSDTQGMEISRRRKKPRTAVYYCHPFASCERGTNENINRMIRRFIPKGADIGKYTDDQIRKIQDWINNYPRRILGGLSSNQYMESLGIAIPL